MTSFGLMKSYYDRLPRSLKGRLAVSLVGALCVSCTQLAVVGAVSLLGAALTSPVGVVDSKWLSLVWQVVPKEEWGEPRRLLMLVSSFAVCAVLANNCLRGFNQYWAISVGKRIESFFGTSMLHGFLAMPYSWHLNNNPSDLIVATSWSARYGTVGTSLVVVGCELLTVFVVLGSILLVAPATGLGCFGVLFILGVALFKFVRRRLDVLSVSYRDLIIERARTVFQAVQGVKDAKLSGREAHLLGCYQQCMDKAVGMTAEQEVVRAVPMLALEFLGFSMLALAIVVLLQQEASYGHIAGTVALLAAAGWRILPCLNKILDAVSGLRVSWPFLEKAERYFAEFEKAGVRRQDFGHVEGDFSMLEELALREIEYRYEGSPEPVLNGINMTLKKGEAVGVVGSSGAGKSTFVNVLCGLLKPDHGQVLLDGSLLDNRGLRSWQISEVGYVPQAPYIFDGTLRENIAYGFSAEEIDHERVMDSCRMAAIDFLDALPKGVDTRIGERGARLSGGQQQRVAIARALYKRPGVLVFDEATSALDSQNEKSIQKTIYDLKGSTTLVVVAHRLSTVVECDSVVWLDKGRVVQIGTPDEVLPAYREFLGAKGAEHDSTLGDEG